MDTTVAVSRTPSAPFSIEVAQLDDPRDDEVRVRMVAAGVCHTDALVRDGVLPTPHPVVLGHEGSGVVEAVGKAVAGVAPGDHVALGFDSCGTCSPCRDGHPAYCDSGQELSFAGRRPDGTTSLTIGPEPIGSSFFGQSSFSSVANVAARSIVKVPETAPLELVGPLGCGIGTGAGTVLNVLRPSAADSIVVFGAGAVGSAALLAAQLLHCRQIIVVDVLPERLDLARELGATDVVDGRDGDAADQVRSITRGIGARFAIDTTGNPAVFRSMVDCLAVRGSGVLLGASSFGTLAAVDIGRLLVRSPTITGVIEGDAIPQSFIPYLIDLHERGLFPFDRLIRTYAFAEINTAFADAESGRTIKPVLRFPAA